MQPQSLNRSKNTGPREQCADLSEADRTANRSDAAQKQKLSVCSPALTVFEVCDPVTQCREAGYGGA